MFANGVTFMPVVVGEQIFTLEVHGMHELEIAPEMHGFPSLFDDWTCEDFDQFERETWPLPMTLKNLGSRAELAECPDGAATPVTVPGTPTEGSSSISSPDLLTEPNEDSVTAESAIILASSETFQQEQAPSSDSNHGMGACVWLADAGTQGSTAKKSRRRRLLSPLKADGSERPLPKDATGYAVPLAVYTRLSQLPKVKTTDLDDLLAPPSNAHALQAAKGKETIRCRFTRSIKEGVWVASQRGPCGIKIQGLESYRRHVIQCHLDVPRVANKKQEEVIEMRLKETATKIGSTTTVSMDSSSSSGATTSQLADWGNTSSPRGHRRKWESDSDTDEDEDDDGKDLDFVPGGNKSKKRRIRTRMN
ncbi:hypothetical protein FRB91_008942 [Serendipita sp. 411]|nr:hypothetical protein FRC19_002615 [Serendipita sp. 401]KAG8850559.1 hypothetical protein FRB91_008942 [Serendipita sp. 411]